MISKECERAAGLDWMTMAAYNPEDSFLLINHLTIEQEVNLDAKRGWNKVVGTCSLILVSPLSHSD